MLIICALGFLSRLFVTELVHEAAGDDRTISLLLLLSFPCFWSSNCKYLEFFSTLARLPPQSHVASSGWISLDATHCSTMRRTTQSFKTNRCTPEPTGMNFEFLQMRLCIFFCWFVKFGLLDPNLKSTTTGRNQTRLWRLWVLMQEFVASKEFLVYLIDAGAEMLLPFDTKVCSWGWPLEALGTGSGSMKLKNCVLV